MRFWKGFSLFAMLYSVTLTVLVIETQQIGLAIKVAAIVALLKSGVVTGHHYIWHHIEGKTNDNSDKT